MIAPVGDGGTTNSTDYARHGDPVPPPMIDVSIAHPARIYDYLLGGKDNYAADRAVADQMDRATQQYRATQGLTFRSRAEVAAFFAGFALAEPGLVDPASWRPTEVPATETEGSKHFLAGLGVLPRA
jgi:hypothetical protein